MADTVILLALAALLIFGARSYAGKLRHGCCGAGGGAEEKRVRVRDKDASHYPHALRVQVSGMTCSHCAARVENALNGIDGVWAKVDLGSGSALVRMKAPVPREQLERAVAQAGYTLTAAKPA